MSTSTLIPKNPAAANLAYTVETCGGLDDWSATDTVVEAGQRRRTQGGDTFATTAARRFIRLRVAVVP